MRGQTWGLGALLGFLAGGGIEGLREAALPFGSGTRLTFLALLRLPALSGLRPCFTRSVAGGGSGVPSSIATAAESRPPYSAASFSARLDALCRLLNKG